MHSNRTDLSTRAGFPPALKRSRLSAAIGIATVLVVGGVSGSAFAAKDGLCKDGTPRPCKPEGGEEGAGNNLSLPALLPDSLDDTTHSWMPATNPQLGVHYSYGCDKPESLDQFNYPNTSCVDDLANPTAYLNATACMATDAPCYGQDVSRIFWQKVDANNWNADSDGTGAFASVAYVDWGDALEAVSWNESSVIRVETQPYSSRIPDFDPSVVTCEGAAEAAAADPETACKVGFQMWHVSGQGTSEQWGVRATDDGEDTSYNYDSPFEIINTANARLNLTKMEPASADCPSAGGGEEGEEPVEADPPAVGPWNGSSWDGTCTWYDDQYSTELSVTGKYVYGYNWRMKTVALEPCGPDWVKTGWWRLTFYSPPPSTVLFENPDAPNVAPPASPSEARLLPRTAFNAALAISGEEEDDERLYRPEVDMENNLSYIDICIVPKTQGGGGGKPDNGTPGGGKP